VFQKLATSDMFRKPKRKLKESLRKKDENESTVDKVQTNENDDGDEDSATETSREIARMKRMKSVSTDKTNTTAIISSTANHHKKTSIMHNFHSSNDTTTGIVSSSRDLVTSTAEHHPTTATGADQPDLLSHNDGIYRGNQVRNKFHAGPIRAAAHVRVTARFDYQPDICKDYKETGFCGYGDTCIYLHDRTDTVSGWQLERQWEEEQKLKKEKQEQIMNDFATGLVNNDNDNFGVNKNNTNITSEDGIPYACHICREHFKDPVVTNCLHYFCESCIMNYVRTVSEACPICNKDTGSVFNLPTKLIAKKRKVLGSAASQEDDSWEKYFHVFRDGNNV
jgi:RING finger protein 113A